MAWYMKNVEPNLKVVNENPILFVQDEKYKIFYYFNDGKGWKISANQRKEN